MLAAIIAFRPIASDYHVRLTIADRKRGDRLHGTWRVVKYLDGRRHGVFPCVAGEWLSIFRRGFHTWEQDNLAPLTRIDGLVAAVNASNAYTPNAPNTRRAARRGAQAAA
jgi:predicted metal-dependent hydrolase